MTMMRTATTAARRQTLSTIAKGCRPPGNTTTSPSRKLSRTKRAVGGTLLAAPSFLLTPTDYVIHDEEQNTTQDTLTNKASLSTSNSLLTNQDSLKDSFNAFLHSIEPLIHRRMSVGTSCIPHPDKVAKGGEDAYFLSTDMKVMGVADGMHSLSFIHFHHSFNHKI